MIQLASEEGLLRHPLCSDLPCPVLQYADDTLIIMEASPTQLAHLKDILLRFSLATGLHINFDKSTLVPINVTPDTASALSAVLGCPISGFPQTYLGLPLSTTKLRLADMQPLICRHDKYLSGWAGRLPNPAGRTALLKSTLSSLPVYAMCSIALPNGTLDEMEKKDRAFLWTGTDKCSEGHCKVAWDAVALPKEKGGMGITNLKVQNRCLLQKCWDKLLSPPATPW